MREHNSIGILRADYISALRLTSAQDTAARYGESLIADLRNSLFYTRGFRGGPRQVDRESAATPGTDQQRIRTAR